MSVEGIPNGWRLVRVGRVHHGETRIDSNGNPLKWLCGEPTESKNLVIIEPIKDSKQYREPELSDLANGPIEIEACTPDPGPGYRLLSKDPPEPVVKGDDFWCDTYWEESDNWRSVGRQCSAYYRRKIEQAPQAEQVPDVKVTIYREPTQRDLANGPIRCRVRDSKEDMWLDRDLHAVMPETVVGRFVTISEDKRNVGSWKYCEIPSDHQAIRVGDLVRVTARPVGVYREGWRHEMNRQVNKVAKVSGITHDGRFLLNGCGGWRFHRDWLELVETASEAKGGEA